MKTIQAPNQDPHEIAAAALAFWDMQAEASESPGELCAHIAKGLIEFGLAEYEAKRVAEMANAAFDLIGSLNNPADYRDDPIFQAMVGQLQNGDWDIA